MVGEAIAPGSVEDVMLKVRSCHAEISGMNVERLIRDVKEFWDIDLIDFAYKHNFGPYPNFAAVVNFIRNIEGATLVPMRNRSGNFFVHFKRPDCLAQMVSMIHASKDKKRNRPSFRKNNGQSSHGNYNRSSYSGSSQSLHWNNNQKSTNGAKTRLVYEFYQTKDECGDSKDMKDLQSSKNQDKEQLYKAPNDQQSPNIPVTQQFSENPSETDSGTFENSEFARWYRAHIGQSKPSDVSKDEKSTSRRAVAPHLPQSIFDENVEKILINVENFPETSKKKQKGQKFVNTKWGEMPLKDVVVERKVNDIESIGHEKEDNIDSKVRGGSVTMGFSSMKITKDSDTSPVINDEEIRKVAVNEEDKSKLNGKGEEDLGRTKDALFDEDDEDVLPTMEEVEQFLGEQVEDQETNKFANDPYNNDPDVIKDDETFFKVVDNLLAKKKNFKFPAMMRLTYVGNPPRLHKVKALN